ncbi:MAG: 50S ribosomal protein L25 [bacterium]|nr:50S ribosomal protein L25 [bacterium]
MLTLKAEKREVTGKKVRKLRNQGELPAVLYGPEVKNISLKLNLKEFEKIYKKTGETSLISLEVESDKFSVLVYDVKRDPLTNEISHIDFYQPILTKEVEASVPIVFEGESFAVKDLGGTLIKEIQEIKVSALPQNLPHEIKVDISSLKAFEDVILIKDLIIPENVKILKEPDEVVANVAASEMEKIEKELEKPIEEKTEEVERVEEKEKSAETEASAEEGKKDE